jgi:hemerythrin-like domain-containing protein
MRAFDVLEHEHEVILLVLDAVEREATAIRAAGKADAARVGRMLDFVRQFSDRCHHAKEERLLFPRLEQRGIARAGGPIGVMLAEHDRGREFVRAAAEALPAASAGDGAAATRLAAALAGYASLLRAHIAKENNVLYPMGRQVCSAADDLELTAAFERVEAEEMGAGTHEKYHRLAHELAGA